MCKLRTKKSADRAVVEDATYSVAVEPPAGSPNGKPSGPPMFVGKLIPVGPKASICHGRRLR